MKNSSTTKNGAVASANPVIKTDPLLNIEDSVKISIDGLIIKGYVAGRTRRNVGDKNIELVTYKISAGADIYFIKDWAPKHYFPVGKPVELPVRIKPYQTNGRVRLDYTICNCSSLGEEF